jgi:RNA polymerase sigma factor (sigma-70 family)
MRTNEELCLEYQRGNKSAAEELLEQNTVWLKTIVRGLHELFKEVYSFEDCLQEARIGLLEAGMTFNPKHGRPFLQHAADYTRTYIVTSVKESDIIIKISTRTFDNTDYFTTLPKRKNLADFEDDFDESVSWEEKIPDEDDISVEEAVLNMFSAEEIKKLLNLLGTRERIILELHYGLNGNRTHTIREIAGIMNISYNSTQALKLKACEQLREFKILREISWYHR